MTILAIDLATATGWAVSSLGIVTSGTMSFKGGRYEGGGMHFGAYTQKWSVHLGRLDNRGVLQGISDRDAGA